MIKVLILLLGTIASIGISNATPLINATALWDVGQRIQSAKPTIVVQVEFTSVDQKIGQSFFYPRTMFFDLYLEEIIDQAANHLQSDQFKRSLITLFSSSPDILINVSVKPSRADPKSLSAKGSTRKEGTILLKMFEQRLHEYRINDLIDEPLEENKLDFSTPYNQPRPLSSQTIQLRGERIGETQGPTFGMEYMGYGSSGDEEDN
jgi:hypothetical protein